ncbi:MAG: hypothetical protein P4L41_13630 [Flavipsychrobacter sp.]|nr:hypothetical protein [Flavipsychrobacter sp.]
MKQKIAHILDSSVCITKRQLKEYISGAMTVEECHAVEHHVNGCAFCSDAIDGAFAHTPEETLAAASDFNGSFLKAHFSLNNPDIHLNSMGPSTGKKSRKGVGHLRPLWLKASIVAALAIGTAIFLFLQTGKGAGLLNLKHISAEKEVQNNPAPAIGTSVAVASK